MSRGERTGGTGLKLLQMRFRLDIRNNFLEWLRHWNRLPVEVMEPLSLVGFEEKVR